MSVTVPKWFLPALRAKTVKDYILEITGGGGGGSTAWSDITGKPTTVGGYGITDAYISSGTIHLGGSSITPLTSFTETDPTVPAWAKAASKPSYTFSEIGSTPSTIAGYGITDAKISSGTITLGSDTITPLTSFTETDPVFSASEAANITSTDTSNWDTAYGWGDHSSAGYLTSVAFGDLTTHPTTISGYGITDAKISSGTITLGSDTITPLTSFTETDPVFSASAAAGISSSDISSWNGKYTKPAGGIPGTDLADTYLTSVAFSNLTSHPTTLSGYGITDAKIESGTITLGSNSITPLTSFTETDPTVPSWAKAASKPSYNFSEIGTTPTTLSGYGITDAKIESGTITLGSDTITPLTSHQSLAGYLPLTAGSGSALTGDLYFDSSSANKGIYAKDSNNVQQPMLAFTASGNIGIGGTSTDNLQTNEKALYSYAYEMYVRWGTNTNKKLYFTSGGTIRPTTNNIVCLGTSSYKYKELYATTLYGNLDWSYIQSAPTTLSGYGITDAQKTITVSSSEPTANDGSDGDIWIVI